MGGITNKWQSNHEIWRVRRKIIFEWRLGNIMDDEEGDMGKIIQNL